MPSNAGRAIRGRYGNRKTLSSFKRLEQKARKQVYLTTRQTADREKLFQASVANRVQQMMLAAASMDLGTGWVLVREEKWSPN